MKPYKVAVLLLLMVANGEAQRSAGRLDECGTRYTPPFAEEVDHSPRLCRPGTRAYTPKYQGLGYQLLDAESEACFVPDESYVLLDRIVEAARQRIHYDPSLSGDAGASQAERISHQIADVLKELRFGLYIPTQTLADALTARAAESASVRFSIDCDTASLIYLTIGDVLSLPLSLVEITLKSGSGHNYVRWRIGNERVVDWDANGRMVCLTPAQQQGSRQGQAMHRAEIVAYASVLRAAVWERQRKFVEAIADYRAAVKDYGWSWLPWNNLAWVIATKPVSADAAMIQEGVKAAETAVSLERTANNIDTLACMVAKGGDIARAVVLENEAIRLGGAPAFRERLQWFRQGRDCAGAE